MTHAARRVAVVGGGVAGLTAAFELQDDARPNPVDVTCYEAEPRAGGQLRSEREKGFLTEWAANGFLDSAPETMGLVRRVGLEDRLLRSRDEARHRFLYVRGKLRELPRSPLGLLASGALPPTSRLRVLMEPFVGGAEDGDASIHDFAARRIGARAAETLVDAFVSGVFAGDSRSLSFGAALPRVKAAVREHGSLTSSLRKGALGPRGVLTSFGDGMQVLTDRLAEKLGSRLVVGRRVTLVSDLGRRGFRVHFEEGAPEEFDALVLACPATAAAELVAELDAELAHELAAIEAAPVAVVHFGYRRDALPPRPAGFGYLLPRKEGHRSLGTLWASDIFEDRAPKGSQLLTTMVGGAHDPEAATLPDDKLIALARRDLLATMEVLPAPYFIRVVRPGPGIPQYRIGHEDRLHRIEARLNEHPGLELVGASYRGVSVNDCVERGLARARALRDSLTSRPTAP